MKGKVDVRSDKQKAFQAELAAASKPKGNEFEAASNLQDARRRLKNLPGNIAAAKRQRIRDRGISSYTFRGKASYINSGKDGKDIFFNSSADDIKGHLSADAKADFARIDATGVGGIREGLAYQSKKREEQQGRTNSAFEKSAASTKAYSDDS